MKSNITDTVVIGSGATAQVYLQTFNAIMSAIVGVLTVAYILIRIRKELKKDDK